MNQGSLAPTSPASSTLATGSVFPVQAAQRGLLQPSPPSVTDDYSSSGASSEGTTPPTSISQTSLPSLPHQLTRTDNCLCRAGAVLSKELFHTQNLPFYCAIRRLQERVSGDPMSYEARLGRLFNEFLCFGSHKTSHLQRYLLKPIPKY